MLKQIFSISLLNLKSIPQRFAPSLVVIVGLAGVVAVFTALLAMAQGFSATLQSTGRADSAIMLRGGSNGAELNSGFGRDEVTLIKLGPGIRKGEDGQPLAAGELLVITELPRRGQPDSAVNVTIRGVEDASFALRPNLEIVEGRRFTPGLRELIVGRGVARQFDGVEVGSMLRMRGSEWNVVGVFEAGNAHDSELWTGLEVAQTTFGRNGASVVLAGLENADSLETLKTGLSADPRLKVDVNSEQAHYSNQTRQFRATIGALAGAVTLIMGLGAIFAALNTMYAAVAARTREIATLRAIGFSGFPVLVSVMIEAVTLAFFGGVLGAAIAWLLFDNLTVSTLGQSFTQVVFAFKVSFGLVVTGLIIAVVIGAIGGLLPAIRAARLPVTTALRTQ
ncbi:MAG: FtsX-like permease family protein [Lysobacteraceae bacterium]